MAGHLLFNSGSNESSLAPQFKWLDNTFNLNYAVAKSQIVTLNLGFTLDHGARKRPMQMLIVLERYETIITVRPYL